MKLKPCFSLFLLLVFSFNLTAAIKIDAPAPEFELTDSYGKTVSLKDYRGQYVILEWTNHGCPYVQKHYDSGNMQGLQKKYHQKDVVWLTIISSAKGKQGHVSAEKANQLTKQRNAYPSHVLFDPDGTVGKQYSAKTTPHIYIIDKQGNLKYAGGIDSIKSANPADIAKATNYLDESMSLLLQNQAVKNPLTRPYGCSIKYKS
ncbi:redoxin domain-containing protein [Gayadomonas joobiniege]|uniref:redoxin domain-containing protein n=1 Tax=Gayadomonas joobiniege TaxID=1234606 RepID=UPI00037156D3|nr:redoxin domain-containing protein [Gayadomonas joobiniege]